MMQMPEGTPLYAAAKKEKFNVMALLLPHYNAR